MPTIKYHYAFDETGHLVSIDEVSVESRGEHSYYCVGCGRPMEARLGKDRARHFAHKADTDGCGTETYLHQLGKYLIKWKFDSEEPFEISYYKDYRCPSLKTCAFYSKDECQRRQLFTIDLKQYYDTCNVEQTIDPFIADLLLTSSKKPNIPPVLIEIQVTHENSPEKRDSGLRIIELRFRKEEDIRSIIQDTIKEHPANERKGCIIPDTKNIGYGKFFGFKRDDVAEKPLSMRPLGRFSLFANGSAHVDFFENTKSCNYQDERRYKYSILELNYDIRDLKVFSSYEMGYVTAVNKGIPFKSCAICQYRGGSDQVNLVNNERVFFCMLYKKKNTPTNPKPDFANQCEYYLVDKRLISRVNYYMKNMIISEVE